MANVVVPVVPPCAVEQVRPVVEDHSYLHTYDNLLFLPNYKLVLDLPNNIPRNARSLRMSLNIQAKCLLNTDPVQIYYNVLVPRDNGYHKSRFMVTIPGTVGKEVQVVANFDVPMPRNVKYFFTTFEGATCKENVEITGTLSIIDVLE
jgi:hypothetical protein